MAGDFYPFHNPSEDKQHEGVDSRNRADEGDLSCLRMIR
jgi:hypothetical protein